MTVGAPIRTRWCADQARSPNAIFFSKMWKSPLISLIMVNDDRQIKIIVPDPHNCHAPVSTDRAGSE